ncbi:Niemann-Pick C1-like protein 1 [Armadillidium nasatum]|uniref:Niemann-Pick C1-like protein 1 n=1 Tax=Armadillidium nasatum TaxID=96803 RepID=A0A5N5SZE6_9CRUS|nr:Niemann-Pick C1-like protein 1 [Armadillidium nasatum]
MPAIYSFSIYAGTALLIDFLLQVTCLVALIVLDAKRENNDRYDVACCLKSKHPSLDLENREDICVKMFKTLFTKFLFNDIVRGIVLLLFVGAFCTSCVFVPKIDIGLEEELGMPEDSYLLKYFDFLDKYLSVGPPVYFVVRDGFDFSDPNEQNIICQSIGCNVDSVLAQVFWASEAPDV